MTPEQKAEVCAALARVLTLEGNAVCADCGQAEGMRPTWASTLCGVLLCMRCAGIHRGLGVHVSKVRGGRKGLMAGARKQEKYCMDSGTLSSSTKGKGAILVRAASFLHTFTHVPAYSVMQHR
eukprot:1148988-Pelagomonas_calceolata.AAC.6